MKIPFERTIAGAYRFAFTNILSIIGIGWFPFLLLIAVLGAAVYVIGPSFMEIFATAQTGKPDGAKALQFISLLLAAEAVLLPVLMVLTAMVTVGVMRKALGQHPGPVFFFFSLGSQVWRLVGSYLLLMLLMIGLVIALVAGVTAIYFIVAKFSQPGAIFATVMLGIAAYCFWIYAFVRVYFFLPAIVVAENHIGLRRSWHLGGGNFWRIVGIVLIMAIPVGIAAQTIEQPVLQIYLGGPLMLQPGSSPEDLRHFLAVLFTALKHAAPILAVVQLLHWCLLTGLLAGASANAYNLVTGGSDIAPPPTKVPA